MEHGALRHCPCHLSCVRRSATRRFLISADPCSALPRCWQQAMGYLGGRSQPEERGRRCRLQMWERRHRRPGGEERPAEMSRACCNSKKGGCRGGDGLSACGSLGTWPAISDVGRRTPESTSAEEKGGNTKTAVFLWSPSLSPPPLPIYLPEFKRQPHSPEGLAEVAKGWAVRSSSMRAKIQYPQCCPLYGPV